MTKKNFILISPHFPDNFTPFAQQLKKHGLRTLGIADVPYEQLSPSLKEALTEYYRVDNMEDYEQVYRAVAYFAHKYGRIDRIESHNEHWLALDARLRTDFNVVGYQVQEIPMIRQKSHMKAVFRSLGFPVADGRVFKNQEDAFQLAEKLKYPVIIKSDSGVGASDTYKIDNQQALQAFFTHWNPTVSYIMEAFVLGEIETFDGLADANGKIVFYSTFHYSEAVLDTVEKNGEMFYFIPREIPEDLIQMGKRIVEAFHVKERFFHLEFFRTKKEGKIIPLEVNMRPPGGLSVDMFNYANNIDVFRGYAQLVATNEFTEEVTRPYHCAYVSRKNQNAPYRYSNDELQSILGKGLISIQSIPGIFAQIMGDEGYLIRTPDKQQLFEWIQLIHQSGKEE
ncbi:ATP-grasp domain-containing protein [Enterococcus sp. LJL98]